MKRISTFCLILFFLPFLAQAQSINEGIVSQRLLRTTIDNPQEQHLVYILLSDHIDAKAMGLEFDKNNLPIPERVATLIHALKGKAAATQPDFINYIKTLGGVNVNSIKPYWITNAIFVEADAAAISAISNRDEIYWMDINVENALDEVETIDCAMPPEPNGTEPGLRAINAPALWAMGYTGYGQIAFSADTGIDPWHPAISLKYRGLYADDSETWVSINPSGNVTGFTNPTNCGDHGNHTTGTMLGLDRMNNDTIGVAYGSTWIGAAILCGIGTADNIGALQWALDPDNNPATIEDMPDVINNSWHDPSLDPQEDCSGIYPATLDALEAAGVATIFSAGNAGPEPNTITMPHNINTDTLNSFTVGALNGNNPNFPITDFSSIGPSHCGGVGSLLIKPEVSAPGQNVRSCELGESYGQKSGTSMAAPHVAGAVLLLKEAFPYLTGKDLLRAIYHTCTDLGDVGEDNTYGMGIINVLEAYNLLVAQGNAPVSPEVEMDVLVVGFAGANNVCTPEFENEIIFENAGTAELTSLDINYSLINANGTGPTISGSTSWGGNLLTKERASIVIEGETLANGYYLLEATLSNPNGIADEKPLNNKGIKQFTYYASEEFEAYLGGFDNTQPCSGSSATLYADYEGPGTIYWYTTPNGAVETGEGNFFTTPPLNFDFTYYADLIYTTQTGEEILDQQTFANDIEDGGGLIFDADFPFTIRSVKVYPESPGTRYLQLFDDNGEMIASKALYLFDAGEQRVEINLKVPVGSNMLMVLGEDGNTLPYSGTATFPYTIGEDLGTIKQSNHPTAPLDTWFYFYDWEVERSGFCGRKPVEIDVVPATNIPLAQFSTSSDFIDFGNNEAVIFTNESEGAAEWYWTFGDGNVSFEENPNHLYTEEGTYPIVLTVEGIDGCSDSYIKEVTVQLLVGIDDPEKLQGKVDVIPNPVHQYLFVKYEFDEMQDLDLKVMDALGRIVHHIPNRKYLKGEQLIDCSDWPNGMYYMVFTNGGAALAKKIIRMD